MDSGPAHAAPPTRPGASDDPAPLPASRAQLVRLRAIAVTGQAIAIAVAAALDIALPWLPMAAVVAAEIAVNAWSAARAKRAAAVTHPEIAALLAFDLGALTALLVLGGGIENPFSPLYLLHAVLIAFLLPRGLALAGTALVVACSAVAAGFAAPLAYGDGRPLPDALIAGALWVGFAVTIAVTAWFVAMIVADLREDERLLREAARREHNDEAIRRMGTLAAGAAHELATPLTTMAVVAGEMARSADTPALRRDSAILAAQVDACRRALSNLTAAAGHLRAQGGGAARLDAFLASTAARFQALRPDAQLTARWDGPLPAPEIFADAALEQAILILLNNAADASPHDVHLTGHWDADALRISVGDRGAGVPPARLADLGRSFFTTKPPGKGTGLGLVLTASTVDRLGGSVRWANRREGGLEAVVTLPLPGLRVGT